MTTQTLVLDQGYRFHRIVSLRKAIGYLLKGKVEVLEEYDEEIGSGTFSIKVPAVVRFLYAFKGRTPRVKFNRINVMARDDFSCQYCGKKDTVKSLTYDHVLPRAQGGKTCWENIVTACRRCNLAKGNRTPEQASMPLRKQPKMPHSAAEIVFRLEIGESIPDAWASWCYWHTTLQEG